MANNGKGHAYHNEDCLHIITYLTTDLLKYLFLSGSKLLHLVLAGYLALLGPLPLYFSLPIRYSFLPSLPRITRLRPEYLQCNNRRG